MAREARERCELCAQRGADRADDLLEARARRRVQRCDGELLDAYEAVTRALSAVEVRLDDEQANETIENTKGRSERKTAAKARGRKRAKAEISYLRLPYRCCDAIGGPLGPRRTAGLAHWHYSVIWTLHAPAEGAGSSRAGWTARGNSVYNRSRGR